MYFKFNSLRTLIIFIQFDPFDISCSTEKEIDKDLKFAKNCKLDR